MASRQHTWEWDSLKAQRHLPAWIEYIVAIFGLSVVLIALFLFLTAIFDDNAAILVAVLVACLGGVAYFLIDGTKLNQPRRLYFRIEDEKLTCDFLGRSKTFSLRRLDWNRVKISHSPSLELVLAEETDEMIFRYPILGMDKSNRREMWREITRYRESAQSS